MSLRSVIIELFFLVEQVRLKHLKSLELIIITDPSYLKLLNDTMKLEVSKKNLEVADHVVFENIPLYGGSDRC